MRWFTADQHWHHKSVISYCKRPFATVEEMNLTLIRRWNALVMASDIVFVLGDMSFGNATKTRAILRELNGDKFLIRGNHDSFSDTWYKREGFVDVFPYLSTMIGGQRVNLSHFPYREDRHDHREFENMLSDKGEWLIHGHVHKTWEKNKRMINVGVDVRGFCPVSETLLCLIIGQK